MNEEEENKEGFSMARWSELGGSSQFPHLVLIPISDFAKYLNFPHTPAPPNARGPTKPAQET